MPVVSNLTQFVGWVEPFAKPIASLAERSHRLARGKMMGFASALNPSYALDGGYPVSAAGQFMMGLYPSSSGLRP